MTNLRRIIVLSLCLLPLCAETTIRDTIRAPIAGGLFNGDIIVSTPDLTWEGQTYRRRNTTVLVTNGALYLRLIPTIADPDGLSYRVQYVPRDGSAGWVEFWVVPDTTEELKIYQVNRASQPATGASVGLHQLAGARGNSGRALCSDGTIWTSCDLLVNPAFTPGDLLFRGTAGLEALNIGTTAGHVLTVQAGRPAWATLSAGQVTQHQAALAIGWGQLTGLPMTFAPSAHAHTSSEIISGLLDLARIPSLPAGQITSGTFADARIGASAVTQHQAALAIGWSQLTGLPTTFAPSAHAHTSSDIISGLLDLARIPSLPAGQITSGTLADARIGASSVTQHQAALTIGWSQLAGLPTTFAPSAHAHTASEIISGLLDLARIPSLPAGQITSGTLADARIGSSSVTQHQAALAIGWGQLTGLPTTFTPSTHAHTASEIISGLLDLARIPSLPAGQITSGTLADARIGSSSVTQHQAALAIGWGQIPDKPAIESPLSFGAGLVRTGNNVTCPGCGSSGAGGLFTKTFTTATTVTVPFSEHGYPNNRLIVDCYDAAGEKLEADSVHLDPSTFAIAVYFSPAQSGSCVVVGTAFVGKTISQSFAASSVLVPNVAEELGTPLFAWRVYDDADNLLLPDSSQLDGAGNFTVYFSQSLTGRLVLVAR